jgi:hypothetical protein
MAAGDIKWFAQGLLDFGNKIHNLSSDVLKLGIVTSTTAPTVGTAAPHWGGTGTTNFASNQVGTGGTSYTGPKTLTSQSWSSVSNVPTLRATDIAMAQDASGFTNGRYGIIYNDTDANKRALAFIDFGADRSLVTGSLTIDFGGAGTDILTLTQS